MRVMPRFYQVPSALVPACLSLWRHFTFDIRRDGGAAQLPLSRHHASMGTMAVVVLMSTRQEFIIPGLPSDLPMLHKGHGPALLPAGQEEQGWGMPSFQLEEGSPGETLSPCTAHSLPGQRLYHPFLYLPEPERAATTLGCFPFGGRISRAASITSEKFGSN